MKQFNQHLDCCNAPSLETLKGLYEGHHDSEAVCQCASCQAFWFYRFHEYVTFLDDDDWTVWLTRLSEEEARALLGESAEGASREFLASRAAFMFDRGGVRRVQGQPAQAWG